MMDRFKKFLHVTVVVLQLSENVYAQTSPNFTFNYVPTAQQWNNYFSQKADYPGLFGYKNTWTGIQTFTQSVNFGSTGAFSGIINFYGATSGIVSVTVPAIAGSASWTLPNSPGTQSANLMSTGISTPLSWTANPNWDLVTAVQNVNFNAVGDTSIAFSSPTPNFVIGAIWVVNTGTASNLVSGSFSFCSQAGGAGTCLVTAVSLGATQTGINKNGNTIPAGVSNAIYTNITTWFFRVVTPVGSASSGDVIIDYRPMPIGAP